MKFGKKFLALLSIFVIFEIFLLPFVFPKNHSFVSGSTDWGLEPPTNWELELASGYTGLPPEELEAEPSSPGGLGGLLYKAILKAIAFVVKIILKIARGVLYLSIWMVTWTLSNPFDVSFTSPHNNPVIDVGWTFLRDFTNLLFILGLAYIGLATALNLGTFNTQRTFAKLIVVALIINFTPVICGAVVDIANIISLNFFSGTDFSKLLEVVDAHIESLSKAVENLDALQIMRVATLIFYCAVGAFILFLFSVLFFFRPLMIWLLVIFSPLAFFAWIFKETQSWFERWWKMFLDWSIIAIPAGFFFYLSRSVLQNIDKYQAHGSPAVAEILVAMAPYLVALVFLGVGFHLTLNVSAAGANKIIATTKKGMIKAGVIGGKVAGEAGLKTWSTIANRRPPLPGEKEFEEFKKKHKRLAKVIEIGHRAGQFVFTGATQAEREKWAEWEKEGFKGKAKKFLSRGGRMVARTALSSPLLFAPFWGKWVTRKISETASRKSEERFQKSRQKIEKMTLDEKRLFYKSVSEKPGPIGSTDRIALLLNLLETGQLKDVIPSPNELKGFFRRTFNEALNYYPQHANKLKWFDIDTAMELAQEKTGKGKFVINERNLQKAGLALTEEDKTKGMKTLFDKLASQIKPEHVEYLDKNTFERLITNTFFLSNARGAHLEKAIEKFGEDAVRAINNMVEVIAGTKDNPNDKEARNIQIEVFSQNYPLLYGFLRSTAASALGVGFRKKSRKKESLESWPDWAD